MNSVQFSNLNKSLKKAFAGVSKDMSKLRKRDQVLKDELVKLVDKVGKKVTKDEFYRIIRKIDDDMKETVHRDQLKGAEERIRAMAHEIIEVPQKKVDKINKRLDQEKEETSEAFNKSKEDKKALEKQINDKIKDIKDEFARTENLKKEVKDVMNIKKSLLNLDERYAGKAKMDTAFEEIDEIYDLVEELENNALRKDDPESVKKDLQKTPGKFETRIKDAEDAEDELHRKTKDIYDAEKNIEQIRKDVSVMQNRMKLLDNTAQIDKVQVELMKEINKFDTRLVRQNETMKELNNKLNDIIKLVNKESSVPVRKFSEKRIVGNVQEESEDIKTRVKKLDKKQSSKYQGITNENTESTKPQETISQKPKKEKKGVLNKVVDWFTEEVEEDESENK